MPRARELGDAYEAASTASIYIDHLFEMHLSPKVYSIMSMQAMFRGLGPLFCLLLRSKYGPCQKVEFTA